MIKLEDYEYKLLQRISNKLDTKIDIKEIDDEYYIKNDEYHLVMDDLYDYASHIEEELEDLKADIEENYEPKHTNPYSFYGINERDFH